MYDHYIERMIVGWPGILTSVCMLFWGVIKGRTLLTLGGAVASLPFIGCYLAGMPSFRYWILLVAICNFAAVFIPKTYRIGALALLLPYMAIIMWLAIQVYSGPSDQLG